MLIVGIQTLHFLLAQNFWILSPRYVLSKCMVCFRVNPTSLKPILGRFPPSRITQLKLFQHVGVDSGGPFNITLGKRREIKGIHMLICILCHQGCTP